MKKQNFLLASLCVLLLWLGACKSEEKTLPLPDFQKLILEAGTFSGQKYDKADPVFSLRNTEISVTAGSNAKEVIFKEGTTQFTVQLDSAWSNASSLKIPMQQIGIFKYVGVPLYQGRSSHGFYEIKDSNKNPINKLSFAVSISNRTWVYSLDKKK